RQGKEEKPNQHGEKDDRDAGESGGLGQPHQDRPDSRRQPSEKRVKEAQSARLQFLPDRVLAAGVPWVAAQEAAHTHVPPFQQRVAQQGLARVLGARGIKAASPWKQRRNRLLVYPDRAGQQAARPKEGGAGMDR